MGHHSAPPHDGRHGTHGIVPPFLLERISVHAPSEIAACADRTLSADRPLRARRRDRAPESALPGLLPDRTAVPASGPHRFIADARGTTVLPGALVRSEGDPPTGDAQADEAHDGLGHTWTLLAEAFSRNSLDGAGAPLLGTVHYGERYDNAFWNGERMVFGDGDGEIFLPFTGALDVIGHELAHGLIEHTANLVYQDQAGALNESIADVIGSLTKQHSRGETAEAADWLIGDALLAPGVSGRALRSMADPGTAYDDPVLGRDPQPGHMDDFVVTEADHGGVHINSGIPNRAFHLASIALGGHAWERAGRVWFDALLGGLSATADFQEFAQATVRAAEAGFPGTEVPGAITAAWQEVGIALRSATAASHSAPPPQPPTAEPTPAADPSPSQPPAAEPPQPTEGPQPPSSGPPPLPTGPLVEPGPVEVQRSGGFAGRTIEATVDPGDLAPEAARELRGLIEDPPARVDLAAGAVPDDTGQDPPESRMPDGFVYRVRTRTTTWVTISEAALPQAVRSALERALVDRPGSD